MTTLKDAIATVLSRNAFYRDGYRLLLRNQLDSDHCHHSLGGGYNQPVFDAKNQTDLFCYHLGWTHYQYCAA